MEDRNEARTIERLCDDCGVPMEAVPGLPGPVRTVGYRCPDCGWTEYDVGNSPEFVKHTDEPGITKRVRILVAMDIDGKWVSAGYDYGEGSDPKDWIAIDDLDTHLSYHWVEADVPVPVADVIKGVVRDD